METLIMKLVKLVALLAVVVAGERPDLLGIEHQEQGAALVCHTFLNWIEADYVGDPERLARERFWGWQTNKEPVPDWIGPVVERCIESHKRHDPTKGAYFVFSRQDLTDNRWTWHDATARAGTGQWALFTFRQIPSSFPEWPRFFP